jgi:predicted deacylase
LSSGLRTPTAGWWQPAVDVGKRVEAGDRLGTVLDGFGDVLEVITAPEAGVLLFLTSSPAVQADGLLLGLGARLRDF